MDTFPPQTETITTMYPYGSQRYYTHTIEVDPVRDLQEWRERAAKRKFHRQLNLILKRKNLNKSNVKAARVARRKNRGK